MSAYQALVGLHVAAGAVGLLSMIGALLGKKGTTTHRRMGWVFAVAMAGTSAAGLVIALIWVATPARRDAGLFFLVIALVTAQAIAYGVLAARNREQDTSRLFLPRMLSAALGVAGLAACVTGLPRLDPFLMVAGGLGIANAVRTLRPSKHGWLRTHVEAMLGGCTAATTAFTVQLSARLSTTTLAVALAWTVPVALGVLATAVWTRRLRTRKMVLDAA